MTTPAESNLSLNRRAFLTTGLTAGIAASATALAGRNTHAQPAPAPAPGPDTDTGPGLILREKEPENLESSFSRLAGPITPTERFYVRSHFKTPDIDPAAFRLTVEGAVDHPLTLTLDDLKALKPDTREVTLECAGNGRIFLSPKKDGVQWELGAVSNATWTGVPLSAVLEQAGVKSSAVEILFEGLDKGAVDKPSKPAGEFHFSRSLPMTKVRAGDVLLAYAMNGKPLTKAHGFPLRLIVPGWYGMASVKWLGRIIALDNTFHGYFQGNEYCYWTTTNGVPTKIPVAELQLKSQIARPAFHEAIPAGKPYRITGAAWTADADIAKVEVSTDDGATYAPAKLLGEAVKNAWRLWEYTWPVPSTPGPATLKSRATDTRGRTQVTTRDPNFESYMICHILPVDVTIA